MSFGGNQSFSKLFQFNRQKFNTEQKQISVISKEVVDAEDIDEILRQILIKKNEKPILFIKQKNSNYSTYTFNEGDLNDQVHFNPERVDEVLRELSQTTSSQITLVELNNLRIGIKFLEYLSQSKIQVQYTSVLLIKLKYAYQLNYLDKNQESLIHYLDCDKILKLKGKAILEEKYESNEEKHFIKAKSIQNKYLRAKIKLQCALMFSESGENQEAYNIAKKILKWLHFMSQEIIVLAYYRQMNPRSRQTAKFRSRVKSECSFTDELQPEGKRMKAVISYFSEIVNLIETSPLTDIKFKKQNDFILQGKDQSDQNINFFVQIQDNCPLLERLILEQMEMEEIQLHDIVPLQNLDTILNEENLLKIIMLCGINFYSLSTEERFLNEKGALGTIQKNPSTTNTEVWLGKALEIFYRYVPHSSQTLSQIISVYKRFFGIEKQMIPEDSAVKYQAKILKPHPFNNLSQINSQFVPVIHIPIKQTKMVQSVPISNQQSNTNMMKESGLIRQIIIKSKQRSTSRGKIDEVSKEVEAEPSQAVHFKTLGATDNVQQKILKRIMKQSNQNSQSISVRPLSNFLPLKMHQVPLENLKTQNFIAQPNSRRVPKRQNRSQEDLVTNSKEVMIRSLSNKRPKELNNSNSQSRINRTFVTNNQKERLVKTIETQQSENDESTIHVTQFLKLKQQNFIQKESNVQPPIKPNLKVLQLLQNQQKGLLKRIMITK